MTLNDRECFGERAVDHFEDPYHRGPLERYTHGAELANPICRDRISVELRVASGVIEEAAFDGDGCLVSQASASMLIERIEQMTLADVRAFSATQMIELFGDDLPPSRQKCCLLAWRTLQRAISAGDDGDEPGVDENAGFGGPSLSEEG